MGIFFFKWWEIYKIKGRDFSGGPVVKNLPCNAEDQGSFRGQETNNLHAAPQLESLHTTTTEPAWHKDPVCSPINK